MAAGTWQGPMRGVIVPLVTPLLDRDTLDAGGLERLIEHVLAGGVQGLFILGTTGEGPSLGCRLRRELIERTCRLAAGRAPVMVGITDTAFVESVSLARTAADGGAAAVVAAPPYYYPARQSELVEYLEHLAAELPLPLLLYNLPGYTKLPFEPETVRAAAAMPGIVGMKDSSGDMAYFRRVQAVLKDRAEFTLMVGPDLLLAECVLSGAHGGVCGGANLLPKVFVDLYRAAAARDLKAIGPLQAQVAAINERIYGLEPHPAGYIEGLKCALACLGICGDFLVEPFHCFGRGEREVIRRNLAEMGLRPA